MMYDEFVFLDEVQLKHKIDFLNKRIKENKKLYNKMFTSFKHSGNLNCINVMNHLTYVNYQLEEEIKYLNVILSCF